VGAPLESAPDEAHRLACDWHGGQWSALYAFLSSGTVEHGLARELRTCLASTLRREEVAEDEAPLREFLAWAELAESELADDEE
jgi:hypothetical protein